MDYDGESFSPYEAGRVLRWCENECGKPTVCVLLKLHQRVLIFVLFLVILIFFLLGSDFARICALFAFY
jgi:hypothetical protein